MILLVAPDQECLVLIVVDTTASGPIPARISGLQETISLLEEEMVVNQLLLHLLSHSGQWVELTLQLAVQARQSRRYFVLHFLVLSFSQARIERITL